MTVRQIEELYINKSPQIQANALTHFNKTDHDRFLQLLNIFSEDGVVTFLILPMEQCEYTTVTNVLQTREEKIDLNNPIIKAVAIEYKKQLEAVARLHSLRMKLNPGAFIDLMVIREGFGQTYEPPMRLFERKNRLINF